jgi:hypothetical protein
MRHRRNENIYQLTERLRQSNERDMGRYVIWLALGAALFVADLGVNAYWKATTGHTALECILLHSSGCDAPSLKIHGE